MINFPSHVNIADMCVRVRGCVRGGGRRVRLRLPEDGRKESIILFGE